MRGRNTPLKVCKTWYVFSKNSTSYKLITESQYQHGVLYIKELIPVLSEDIHIRRQRVSARRGGTSVSSRGLPGGGGFSLLRVLGDFLLILRVRAILWKAWYKLYWKAPQSCALFTNGANEGFLSLSCGCTRRRSTAFPHFWPGRT